MRIVHCADVHIGMEFAANRARSRQRKAEIVQGFLRVVEYCQNESADVLLIAGDLFDGEHVEQDVVNRIKEAFAKIPQVDIYIAPGNHDPLTASSPYRQEGWSSNVTVFEGRPRIIERPDKGYRIWGCGFESAFVEDRLLMGARLPQDELVNIGILHGQLVGKGGRSIYNAVTDSDIEKSGLDYLALGHVHKQTEILRLGKTFYAYSGTVEGQGFDEEGIKGFYTGELSRKLLGRGELIMEYVSLSRRRYYHVEADVSGAEGRQEIMERIYNAVEECDEGLYKTRHEDNLYKITLVGEVLKERTIPLEDIRAELSGRFYYVKIRDRTSLVMDYEELAEENSLKGMFAARMLEKMRGYREKNNEDMALVCRRALELGIRAVYGEVDVNED